MSDGSIFMLRELSAFDNDKEYVIKNLDGLSNLGYIDHFKHAHVMKENLWKSMCVIVENLGKKMFRGYIELFLDPVFRCAKNEQNACMAVAAQDFVLALEKTYGEGIFKAIVEGHDERLVAELKTVKDDAAKGYQGKQDFIYTGLR